MGYFEDMTPEERAEYDRKQRRTEEWYAELAKQKWPDSEAGKLCQKLYDAYRAYEKGLEKDFIARDDAERVNAAGHHIYHQLQASLAKANQVARCTYMKPSGQQCRSPRMGDTELCYAHTRISENRAKSLELPSLEDANGVQLALMKIAKWLIDGEVDAKKATAISYLVQTAASNVGRVNFEGESERGNKVMR